MTAAALALLFVLAQGQMSPQDAAPTPPPAATGEPSAVRAPCPWPVFFRRGPVRCSERPVATAFGRVTWMEQGRSLSASAALVDLERTRGAQSAARRAAGGFSVTGAAAGGGEGSAAGPKGSVPAGLSPAGSETEAVPQPAPSASAPPKGLSPERRAELQSQLHQAEVELEVMEKNYRALILSGRGASNTLSSAINRRKRVIADLRQRLSQGR